MATNTPGKKKFNAAIIPMVVGAVYLAGFTYLSAWGLYWVASGNERCLKGWDARFQPQFDGAGCSILQRGLRVPVGEYWSPDEIRDPEPRD
jgi:hypothetical protein